LVQAKRTYYLYADEGLLAEATQTISLNADGTVTAATTPQVSAQYGPTPDAEFTTGILFIKTQNSNGQDTVAYYHHDHLQTPIQATDKQGNLVWSAAYEPFGKATITTPAATADSPTITTNLRLPGQYFDDETGLHYNFRRYYDPSIGRYVTSDPIGIIAGINYYVYVIGNPLMYYDPYGLYRWDEFIDDSANFSAGFGDSLSFGLTGYIRNGLGIQSVNKCSSAYRNGEIADIVFELGSMGLSAGLKSLAAGASRKAVRSGTRPFLNAFREANGLKGGFVHHSNPLFGHPGGVGTMFPTGGLPAWFNSGNWNLKWFADRASHNAEHRWMRGLENTWRASVNPGTTGVRTARDIADNCGCL